jgi:hypothetical protein
MENKWNYEMQSNFLVLIAVSTFKSWPPSAALYISRHSRTLYSSVASPTNSPAMPMHSGGNLGGVGGGGRPPPPTSGKLTNFRKFWSKRGLKTVFSSGNGGGGMSEIWKFCRKFRRLCPPPPEKVNFRHCLCKYFCVHWLWKQLISKEMNNDNNFEFA